MINVNSIDSLVNGSMPAADILVERDFQTGRARVSVNGRLIMEDICGNFHPARIGGWHLDMAERHGTWLSPETLADVLCRCLSRLPDGCLVRKAMFMSGRD